jgi:hypothetical protein
MNMEQIRQKKKGKAKEGEKTMESGHVEDKKEEKKSYFTDPGAAVGPHDRVGGRTRRGMD